MRKLTLSSLRCWRSAVVGVLTTADHQQRWLTLNELTLALDSTESCKIVEQKFIFQIGTFNRHVSDKCFSFN